MLGRRLAAAAAAVSAMSLAAGAPSASAAEAPTPQAVAANAEFLAYAPPPPVPAKVCVVDTGVDLTTDAAPAVVERHSVFGGTTDDVGGSGLAKHGTFVAGVIASQLDGRDSVGIWPHARIVSVRVFEGSGGHTTTAAVIAALERCRQLGAVVVNLSLSGLDQMTATELSRLDNRISALRVGRGLSVVAGAGNNGGAVGFPARFASVLAVGATDANGQLCAFSNRGDGLDVTALGCSVELSWLGGGVGTGTGTSYSTPVVSATLAALRAYRSNLTADEAEGLLIGTAQAGQLDASRAFFAAGLHGLVRAPAVESPVQQSPQELRPEPGRGSRGSARSLVGSPRVVLATYRRRFLRIRIAGVSRGGRAVFAIDGRRYIRQDGRLRLRLVRRPRRVQVHIDVAGFERSRAVTVRLATNPRSPTRDLKRRG